MPHSMSPHHVPCFKTKLCPIIIEDKGTGTVRGREKAIVKAKLEEILSFIRPKNWAMKWTSWPRSDRFVGTTLPFANADKTRASMPCRANFSVRTLTSIGACNSFAFIKGHRLLLTFPDSLPDFLLPPYKFISIAKHTFREKTRSLTSLHFSWETPLI